MSEVKDISPELAKEKMLAISKDDDTEVKHVFADNLMCAILIENGFEEAVDIFHSMDKWYA